MSNENNTSVRLRWARLRFSIVGTLLSSPAETGDLGARISELAGRTWRHPTTGEAIRFSSKSIERWYYTVRAEQDPIRALERKVPAHVGTYPSMSEAVVEAVRLLRQQHPRWSAQLVHDNLVAMGREQPQIGVLPGYATVCRYMKHHGLGKQRRLRKHEQDANFVPRERRLFEVGHVHGLWHADFHDTRRKVLTAGGNYEPVTLLAVLDDRSRLCCHAQWYVGAGNTENFIHGLCQAFSKRGLPRAFLSDNGSPMLAAETEEGLCRLSIEHYTTLAYTPEQNGKQEVFFSQIEGRLIAMLEGEPHLTLELLNRATQAWVEEEYQRHLHSEMKQSPWDRFRAGPDVGRPCPSSDELRRAFRMEMSRKQRTSDGTITVAGVRYEIPSVYRTLLRPTVRVARWDLSSVDLVDPRRGLHLTTLFPVDRERNAERHRRTIKDASSGTNPSPMRAPPGIAPLLRQQMADYSATGHPPAYVPYDITEAENTDEQEQHDPKETIP
jgi:transposase InsO family protein